MSRQPTWWLLLGLTVGLLACLILGPPGQSLPDRAWQDVLLPAIQSPPKERVVIITIDDPTLNEWKDPMAFWGDRFAAIVKNCLDQGADKVVLDIIPAASVDEFLDSIQAPAGTRPNTALGLALLEHPDRVLLVKRPEGTKSTSPSDEVLLSPEVAERVFSAELSYSLDGRVRQHFPETAGVPTISTQLAEERSLLPIPQEPVYVSFPPDNWPRYSAVEAARPSASLPQVKGAVVFIGAASDELGDIHLAAGGRTLSGLEVHAHNYSSLVEGRSWRDIGPAAYLLHFFALIPLSLVLRPERRHWLVALAPPLIWGLVGAGLALWAKLLIPVGSLAVVGVLATESAWLARSFHEAIEKSRLSQIFGVHVSPSVRDHLMFSQDAWTGRTEVATVLFLDIRGSTTMAEKMPPSQVLSDLNQFFEESIKGIEARGGLVNRFLGDGYLALFGVPKPLENHADAAMDAALETLERLAVWNDAREKRGMLRIECGIGIHTGVLCHGMIGSATRQEYTVVGDTVNAASRIQDLTKALGAPLVISAETQALLTSPPSLTRQDNVMLKGRTEPSSVYLYRGKK